MSCSSKPSLIYTFLSSVDLSLLCDERTLGRGTDYYRRGHVVDLVIDGERADATVIGQQHYRVTLCLEERPHIEHRCSCPMGRDGWFCKHCIAVVLAVRSAKVSQAKERTEQITLDDIRMWLKHQEIGTLVELVIEQARENGTLRKRLEIRVAASGTEGDENSLHAFRHVIDSVMTPPPQIYYEDYDTPDNSNAIDIVLEMLDTLGEMINTKQKAPEHLLELVNYAIEQWEKSEDDFEMIGSDIASVQERLGNLHQQVIARMRPKAEELAKRLFVRWIENGEMIFRSAYKEYSELLGKKGREAYQRLVRREWDNLPPITVHTPEESSRRYRLTQEMEGLAREIRDTAQLAAIYQKQLTSVHDYMRLVNLYVSTGEESVALEWAERALETEGKERLDNTLVDFLIDAWLRTNQKNKAMTLARRLYAERRDLARYQLLHRVAEVVGTWEGVRVWALDQVRHVEKQPKHRNSNRTLPLGWGSHSNSLAVEFLLWENRDEEAWKEAVAGGCYDTLWLTLAQRRERTAPHDALAVYYKQIERLLHDANREHYEKAVEILKQVWRIEKPAIFADYLAALYESQKRRRTMIALLDKTFGKER